MDWPLVIAGLAMGVAATPHCAAMCGAPCAALTARCGRSAGGFHVGRLVGYMAGGAVAASSVGLLSSWSQSVPVLRPLWTALHLALLALGLWWLATGRQADWMMKRSVPATIRLPGGTQTPRRRPLRATLAGLAWVAWPCGALQAALLLAALASTAAGGALVMGAFALGSLPALAVLPWVLSRWTAVGSGGALRQQLTRHGYRLAGVGLVAGSGWALTHGLWRQFAAWCLS
jgi:sulfite exporter TauE/SafE